jgi:hypothetical protein
MTKLETLYASIKGLEKVGLTLTDEMLKKADELEEQLIKTEVLPTLSKDIEPRLSQIQRELVLVVEYKPGEPISVALSRKTNIAELLEAKKLELDPQVEHKEFGPRTTKHEKKAPDTEICVYRKDGSILQEHNAATTFVAAIVEAGPLRVRQLGIKYCRINIVSTTKDQKYGHAQREIERGLYVLTHSNTKDKKKMLDRISNALHLGWTVEIIDK